MLSNNIGHFLNHSLTLRHLDSFLARRNKTNKNRLNQAPGLAITGLVNKRARNFNIRNVIKQIRRFIISNTLQEQRRIHLLIRYRLIIKINRRSNRLSNLLLILTYNVSHGRLRRRIQLNINSRVNSHRILRRLQNILTGVIRAMNITIRRHLNSAIRTLKLAQNKTIRRIVNRNTNIMRISMILSRFCTFHIIRHRLNIIFIRRFRTVRTRILSKQSTKNRYMLTATIKTRNINRHRSIILLNQQII